MELTDGPALHAPQRINDAWTALPSWLPVPGMGVLPVNSFLLSGTEPMLVDTGRPPYYDAPETMGFFDEADRVLFSADAFGALLPEPVNCVEALPNDTLREGLVGWSSVDAPWLAQIGRAALGRMVRDLHDLAPAHVLSGHLPRADDLETLTAHITRAYGNGETSDVTDAGRVAIDAAMT